MRDVSYWLTPGGHIPTKIDSPMGVLTVACDFETDNIFIRSPQGWTKRISRTELYKTGYPRDVIASGINSWCAEINLRFGIRWIIQYQQALERARSCGS